MQLPLYIVDAFTDRLFHGNPAAVCPLPEWLPDSLLQQIAAENNLAETAFLVPEGAGWRLRWFTPRVEVDLCGHATLATAFVLALEQPQRQQFRFATRSGELVVTRRDDLFELDFPARALQPEPALKSSVETVLGLPVVALTRAARTLIAELADEATVRTLQPDFRALLTLDCFGLIVTARGSACDFVSRFFAPKVGIDEDPVTGSAHCGLVPYWAGKLGKTRLLAHQVSARGGVLACELAGDRVRMGGTAILYQQGRIQLS